jgi:hypothetical protein
VQFHKRRHAVPIPIRKKGKTMTDLQSMLGGAKDDGLLDQAALDALNVVDLGTTIQDNLGVDPNAIDSTEVFGLFSLIDDSTSIHLGGNTEVVRNGYNGLLDALTGSQSRDDIIVSMMMMNAGIVQQPTALSGARRLDANYKPRGQTPLYDKAMELAALATAKHQEFAATGAAFRGVILLVSDGADYGSKATARRVQPVLRAIQQQEVFQVIALGIEDGYTNFQRVFADMGVLPENILTVKNDPKSIRDAFGVVSRASVTASQGGSVSQSGGLGGFGANP